MSRRHTRCSLPEGDRPHAHERIGAIEKHLGLDRKSSAWLRHMSSPRAQPVARNWLSDVRAPFPKQSMRIQPFRLVEISHPTTAASKRDTFAIPGGNFRQRPVTAGTAARTCRSSDDWRGTMASHNPGQGHGLEIVVALVVVVFLS